MTWPTVEGNIAIVAVECVSEQYAVYVPTTPVTGTQLAVKAWSNRVLKVARVHEIYHLGHDSTPSGCRELWMWSPSATCS